MLEKLFSPGKNPKKWLYCIFSVASAGTFFAAVIIWIIAARTSNNDSVSKAITLFLISLVCAFIAYKNVATKLQLGVMLFFAPAFRIFIFLIVLFKIIDPFNPLDCDREGDTIELDGGIVLKFYAGNWYDQHNNIWDKTSSGYYTPRIRY